MTENRPEQARDASWVIVETPLELPALRDFCVDIERLFRINPYLEFQAWRRSGADSYHAGFRNLSNQQTVALDIRIERVSPDEFSVVYREGIKARTRFALEPTAAGSRVTITDDYSRLPDAERAQHIDEVDKSLNAWGWALHEYLRHERRWGRFAPWRWYMRRLWLPMTPRARRITYMLVLVTAAELVLVLLGAMIYWIEFAG
ncbi:MAG: hypothetical protein HY525_08280 [Betaproteobacteria bacterium]|nr:hypothetical protein [Betaproteobacteria bacterium]